MLYCWIEPLVTNINLLSNAPFVQDMDTLLETLSPRIMGSETKFKLTLSHDLEGGGLNYH